LNLVFDGYTNAAQVGTRPTRVAHTGPAA